jgi:hypothetical protein
MPTFSGNLNQAHVAAVQIDCRIGELASALWILSV